MKNYYGPFLTLCLTNVWTATALFVHHPHAVGRPKTQYSNPQKSTFISQSHQETRQNGGKIPNPSFVTLNSFSTLDGDELLRPTSASRGLPMNSPTQPLAVGGSSPLNVNRPNPPSGAGGVPTAGGNARRQHVQDIWETLSPTIIQGQSLRTWAFADPYVNRLQVLLRTEGRPLNSNIELWHGPDNTPQKIAVYIEDGSFRPFCSIIECPRGHNAVAVRNTGHLEFPLEAIVEAEREDPKGQGSAALKGVVKNLSDLSKPQLIQGGSLKTYPFSFDVASVQILLKTDGRPLNARIELLQGPNNKKQVMEVYTEDGLERPFFVVVETPGAGNVVRIVNTATIEYPLTACVEPYVIDDNIQQQGVFFSTGGLMG